MDKRKELIASYKDTPRPMGVYQIKNSHNGKVLIGSSMDLPGKFNSHRFQLEHRCHMNAALQADWLKNGPNGFTFEVLESLNPEKIAKEDWRKTLTEMEDKWMNQVQPYGDKGYNKQRKISLSSIQKVADSSGAL